MKKALVVIASWLTAIWIDGARGAEARDPSTVVQTNCQVINLELVERQLPIEEIQVALTLAKPARLHEGAFEAITNKRLIPAAVGEIPGLQISMDKAVLVDSYVRENQSWVHSTTRTQVYGVKFKLSADEAIGLELQGDIMAPVRELELHTLCIETVATYQ